MISSYIQKRGNKFSYRRRVPSELTHLDPRKEVKISLRTGEYKEAIVRASIYNEQIECFWQSLLTTNDSKNFNKDYRNAVQMAKAYGFRYKNINQIARSDISEIVDRLSTELDPKQKANALLGGAGESKIRLSDSINLYWGLTHDRLYNKSEHQIRKWKNPRKAAMKNFIKVVSDKYLHDVVRSDVLEFRKWWNEKLSEGMSPISANKQMRFIRDIMQIVAINNEIDIDYDPLFTKVNFRNNNSSRPPFEASFVQNTLLPKLSVLNERDQAVIMAIADTGARLSEIFGLLPDDIKLSEDMPYIWIRPHEGYNLKTKSSERKIPLVGTALMAFQRFPGGFEHTGNPDSFSNNVNKILTNNNLRPTPRHSIYSLRHTFKDRLRDIEAPEEIIDDLMGHKKGGPKYGRGHKLETKLKWLRKSAFNM
ncbi:MAG: hypothetical protein RIF46_03570 [Cyclobacteriaceae bacterium]